MSLVPIISSLGESARLPLTLRSLRTIFRMNKKRFHNSQAVCGKDRGNSHDKPIKFTSSKAATWKTHESFGPPPKDMPLYQPFIVSLSLAVFLTYFFFLREENDVDIELNESLFSRVPGLEESQLRAAIKYNKEAGKQTSDLEKKLSEIQKAKNGTTEQ